MKYLAHTKEDARLGKILSCVSRVIKLLRHVRTKVVEPRQRCKRCVSGTVVLIRLVEAFKCNNQSVV